MFRSSSINTAIVIGVLMALTLLGMVFVEFIVTCTACVGLTAVMFYTFLVFAKFMDRIINLLYVPR